IPAGSVTLKQIMRTLPYNDPLISVKVKGGELRQAMENSVSRIPESGRFLQLAGLELRFDPAAALGSRVKELRFKGAGEGSREREGRGENSARGEQVNLRVPRDPGGPSGTIRGSR